MKTETLFQNQPVFQLSSEDQAVWVSAEHGARILRWTRQEREVITWPEDADWTNILKVRGGDPVLFPFVARHFVDGKNELWRDATGKIRPMPQHGFARDARFTPVASTETMVRLRLTPSDTTRDFFPFAFRFDVIVQLRERRRLEITFETTNAGPDPLPYYAGHHFYFPVPSAGRADWQLNLPCVSWGRQDAQGNILHEEPTHEMLSLADPSLIDRFQIQPLAREITLANSKTGQRLTFELRHENAVPWYAVTTWTQNAESNFYCVEPWLGLPNAIHHGEGLRFIAPGETERAVCILDASGW